MLVSLVYLAVSVRSTIYKSLLDFLFAVFFSVNAAYISWWLNSPIHFYLSCIRDILTVAFWFEAKVSFSLPFFWKSRFSYILAILFSASFCRNNSLLLQVYYSLPYKEINFFVSREILLFHKFVYILGCFFFSLQRIIELLHHFLHRLVR